MRIRKMNRKVVNEKIVKFLSTYDTTDLLDIWNSAESQEVVFGKTKKVNPYMEFRVAELRRIKLSHPDVITRDEINQMISEKWKKAKEDGSSLKSNDEPEETTKDVSYEVSKPFHKFCLDKRGGYKTEFPDDTSIEITTRLKDEWRTLTVSEKKDWSI